MRENVPDLELIHSWLLDRLDKDDLAFARQRGLDLRRMIRDRVDSFGSRFVRVGNVILSLFAIVFYVVAGQFMRSRGLMTGLAEELSFIAAVAFATVVGFAAIRFQARYSFYHIERRMKSKNDLTMQYILYYVTHDINLLRHSEKVK